MFFLMTKGYGDSTVCTGRLRESAVGREQTLSFAISQHLPLPNIDHLNRLFRTSLSCLFFPPMKKTRLMLYQIREDLGIFVQYTHSRVFCPVTMSTNKLWGIPNLGGVL